MDIEPVCSATDVIALRDECGLPVADIDGGSPVLFFGMRRDGLLQAVIGLELYPPVALLRSLAVRPAARQRGFGGQLVDFAETFARGRGVDALYLLTTTTADYFLQRAYTSVVRSSAPEAIRKTSQFACLCPDSSELLVRSLRA
jgi:amino-acid N-acetyltransferase